MDADVLRKQLRKTLVVSKRFGQADLDESMCSDEDGTSGAALEGDKADDTQNGERGANGLSQGDVKFLEEKNALVEQALYTSDSDESQYEEDDVFRQLEDIETAKNDMTSDDEATSGEADENSASDDGSTDDEDDIIGRHLAHRGGSQVDDDAGSPMAEKSLGEEAASPQTDKKRVSDSFGDEKSDDGFHEIQSSGQNFSDDDEDGEKETDHVSVLDAWSQKIQQSVPHLRRRCNSDDSEAGVEVEYVSSSTHPPSSSPKQSNDASDGHQVDYGAQKREELENLGKIFLRVKIETCKWLAKLTQDNAIQQALDLGACTETALLYEVLKSGVLLCKVANALVPGCITQYTTDFDSDSNFLVPLSERENIKRFIRACEDVMGVPPSYLFEVGDLYNMQNMPKVILSLRAIAEHAKLRLRVAPTLHWPHTSNTELQFQDDDDEVLLASSEMSKLDVQTVHHIYEAESIPSADRLAKRRSSEPEQEGFEERRRSVQQNLAAASLSRQAPVSAPKPRPVAVQTSTLRPAPSPSPVPFSRPVTPDTSGSISPAPSAAEPSRVATLSVSEWLETLGMQSYVDNFLDDGWDDIHTVALMSESDLDEVGITKKGHRRKIGTALNKLKAALQVETQNPHSQNGPSGAFGSQPGSATHTTERDILDKDTNWAKCRAEANVTLDLEDAKLIWTELVALREHGLPNIMKYCNGQTGRAFQNMVGLTEDLVRCLIPFDAPIVLDIGWESIKCGFAFSKQPVIIPSIVGKYNITGGSMRNHMGASFSVSSSSRLTESSSRHNAQPRCDFVAGTDVYKRCHDALNASGLSTSNDIGNLAVRRMMHRGIDSIKDPVVIEWDDMERLLDHAFKDVLRADPRNHPVMIVEPAKGWSKHERSKMASILFKDHGCPAVYFSPAAPLVAFNTGLKSCMVLDLGESRSTSSVVFNYRLVRDATVHSPIGGLQLTEFMMRILTQEGFEFKSIFEARNPSKFASLRHFMEQDIAQEILCQASDLCQGQPEMLIRADQFPSHLSKYLVRVTKGTPYIDVKAARQEVPEALFSPELIRRDQFYNGASLPHIVQQSASRCTEAVGNTVSDVILLCGGLANLPGLVPRLQVELDELFATKARKPPRVLLASAVSNLLRTDGFASNGETREEPSDLGLVAWQGAAKVVLEEHFQQRWIPRYAFLERGIKSLDESQASEELGPFPLFSPDTTLYKANRAVSGLGHLMRLTAESSASSPQPKGSSRKKSQDETPGAVVDDVKDSVKSLNMERVHREGASTQSSAQDSLPAKKDVAGTEGILSPRTVKDLIASVAPFLQSVGCPEDLMLEAKLAMYDFFADEPPASYMNVQEALEEILAVQPSLEKALRPYLKTEPVTQGEKQPSSTVGADVDEDDEDDEAYWAMAI